MTTFELNGRSVSVHSPDDTPLLWVIRDEIGLAGTKFGCGIGFLRRLHGARGRTSDEIVHHPAWRRRRGEDHDDRRARSAGQASATNGMA